MLPWWTLGQYGASSCPMPASSGFWSSPGHGALSDAICIAPAHGWVTLILYIQS
jgi:hypothetical protein